MKRVMIVGQPGSGKSTLARLIGDRTGLPVFHMDQIHWMSGWIERTKPEKITLARAVEARETWVFEGGLSKTFDTRLARADTLIVLDLPFALRVWRVFARTLRSYGTTRPDLPDGCPEQFSLEFWHYIWRTRLSGRRQIRDLIPKAGPGTRVYHLCSRRAVRNYLSRLG